MQIEANSRESYVPSHDTNFHSLFIAHRDNTKSEQIQETTLWLRAAPCQRYYGPGEAEALSSTPLLLGYNSHQFSLHSLQNNRNSGSS